MVTYANKNNDFVANTNIVNYPVAGDQSDFSDLSQDDLEVDYYEERTIYSTENSPPESGFRTPDYGEMQLTPENYGFSEKMDLDYASLSPGRLGEVGSFGGLLTNFEEASDKSGYGLPVYGGSQSPVLAGFSESGDKPSDKSGYGLPVYGVAESQVHGGDSDSGHKGVLAKTRPPGPYGYPSPNFKCEYAKETLYVTKTDWTFDKKCFTVYRTKCRHEYEQGKGIGFQKECSEFSVTRCRTEYDTDSETKCWTIFRKECMQVYVTKVDWEYDEKCETKYEEVCEGYGYDKHCHSVPKEHCHQVRGHPQTTLTRKGGRRVSQMSTLL